jgi:hypothetical protein
MGGVEDICGRYETRARLRHDDLTRIMRADCESAIHTLPDNNTRVMALLNSERTV